jgi:hypothetical protein
VQILNYLDFENWNNINIKNNREKGKKKRQNGWPNTPCLGVRRGVTAKPVDV